MSIIINFKDEVCILRLFSLNHYALFLSSTPAHRASSLRVDLVLKPVVCFDHWKTWTYWTCDTDLKSRVE